MPLRRYRLAQRRKTVGLSQERLAEVMGVDRSTVVRWERADTDPQPWHRPRLADALKLSVEELAELLADVGQTASRSTTPASLPSEGEPVGLTAVSVSDLDTLQSFRKADRQVGGRHLYAAVTSYLQRNVAPRLFGHTPDTAEQSVFVAAAGLTDMAGWMAHDAGRDALAEQHFQRALGMAQIGQDHVLAAHICGSLSHLAHHTNQPDRALAYAHQGHKQLAGARRHPELEARLLAMRARGHAATGDNDRCVEHLHQAERALAGHPSETSSPWASSFDEASLAAEAARCLNLLGHLGAARSHAAQVVALRPPERVRSRAFAQLMLVSILIAEGRPDEACGIAREVLDSTQALGSMVVLRQLGDLGRKLELYRHNTDVAAFLDCLHQEIRERRWLTEGLPGADQVGLAAP